MPACGVVTDCSFEGGGAGWGWSDLPFPLVPVGVHPAGYNQGYGFFSLAPTDGAWVLATGFDGDGPGDILAWQDVILTPHADRLTFDYRAGWNIFGTLPREFFVEVQPSGGGAPLVSQLVLATPIVGTTYDTGPLAASVDVSALAGQPVRIVFRWHVPEYYTGPAICQVDRVSIQDAACQVVQNCSFETGSFSSWVALDMPDFFFKSSVVSAGISIGFGLFATAPSDGVFSAWVPFDGGGPGETRLFQDIGLPADALSLDFDWRAGWDMFNYVGSTLPRHLIVDIEPAGGGPALQSTLLLTAPAATVQLDTGPRKAIVPLHAFAGQLVRIVFRCVIPEYYTGPGQVELDHVRISREPCASIANCSFETGALSDWTALDVTDPFIPLSVMGGGFINGYGSFITEPTDGLYAMVHGFDGCGPDAIRLFQDLKLPLWADNLRFDFRAAWDLVNFGGGTLPRKFLVELQPAGGGPPMVQDVALVATPQTYVGDTEPRSRTLPVGTFAGQDVRIEFRWEIPECFTGPGLFQLDHVTLGSAPLEVGPGAEAPRSLTLWPAAPNPSRNAATFRFTLPRTADVELEVVDVHGARVWSERRVGVPAGDHVVAWDGHRTGGAPAPAGVYYARVRTPFAASTRMFVRVR